MNILNALKQLRDDIKIWVTNNFNALNAKIDEKTIPIDSELSSTSTNPVQNKAIKKAIDNIPTFSGDYNDLTNAPDISEDGSDNMIIVDESGNIIFKADVEGIHTTAVSINGEAAATEKYVDEAVANIDIPDVNFTGYATEDFVTTTVNSAKEELSESIVAESDEWKVVDEAGNIIFSVDAEGAHTTNLTLSDETIATQEWVLNQNYLIDEDLVLYAKLTDIPNTSNLATLNGTNEFSNSIAAPEFSTTMNDEYKYAIYYPNHIYYVDDSEGMAYSSELIFPTSEVGTIATREWVQANAPSVDTSNFVTKNDTTLKLTDGDSYAGGHLTLSGINGTLVYADYPNAAPCDTIKLDLGAADSGNAYAVNFKFPKQAMAGDYTLATQEWVTANAPSVDTSDFISKTTTSEQTIKSSFRVHNSEEGSGYRSVTVSPTSLSWTEYVTGNTVNIVEDMSASTFGTSCTLVLPVENGTLATREWFEAQKASLISEIIAALPVYNGEVANE